MIKVSPTLRGAHHPTSLMLGSALLLYQSSAVAQIEPAAPKEAAATLPGAPQAVSPEAYAAPVAKPSDGAVAAPTNPDPTGGQPSQMATAPQAAAVASPQASNTAEATAVTSEPSPAQTDAQVQELTEELRREPTRVNVYGFADVTYGQGLTDRSSFVQYVPYPTFYVGNVNLYLDSDLGHNWRTLVEVRFTYLPDGSESGIVTRGAVGRNSAAYQDYIDFRRTEKVGGIVIQRAWVEYAAHPLLNARVGQWLTPYGIWNVDHGSTVVIPISRPYIIGDELFPQRQTGVELYGSTGFESTQVGYHITLSNGRGPIDQYRDLDKNKAIGWRLWAQQDTSFGTFTLGTSGYKGRYTDRTHMQNVAIQGTKVALSNTYTSVAEYSELNLALDLRWTWKGALVQSEAIVHQRAYEDSARPAAANGAPGWTADTRNLGFYAMAGYRLPWFGIMPFYGYEFYRAFDTDAASFWGGFNVRPTDRIVLKIQETHVYFPSGFGGIVAPRPVDYLFAQIAWSF